MATCPNCGRKLRLIDWRPECPGCGININYYDSNRKLLEESEKAEIEHSRFQPKIDRAKAAYAGSKFAIARIVLTVLPILSLLLPVCQYNGESVNAIKIYNLVSSADIGAILSDAFSGNTLYLALVFVLLTLVGLIASLALITMALGKKSRIRVPVTYGLLFALGFAVLLSLSLSAKGSDTTSVGIGAYIFVVLLAVLFGWNLFLIKKGIPVNYKECLIGGLPDKVYFQYVEQGMSRDELNRKMLIALAELEEKQILEAKEMEKKTNV